MTNLSDIVTQCMHCGLCLPVCPTYQLTKRETSSPRGRIRLVQGVSEGEIPITYHFEEEMHFCLGCYACMSACPAGVRYDEILETGRALAPSNRSLRWILRLLFLKKKRLMFLARMARPWVLWTTMLLRRFAPRNDDAILRMAELCPVPEKKTIRQIFPSMIPAAGPLRARVALFTGCIMDVACTQIHMDSVNVLTRNGCEVHLLEGEECCGALLGHAGDHQAAHILAQKNIEAFGAKNLELADASFRQCKLNQSHTVHCGYDLRRRSYQIERNGLFSTANLDAVVVNAAGCGAFMKKYEHLNPPPCPSPARGEGKKPFEVFDIQEFLDRLGLVAPLQAIPKKVAVQEACHLVHAQKISAPVTNLLKQIPGIEIVPLEGAKDCCGSAGIYNLTHYRDSMLLLDAKMDYIARTGADIVVAANPGCLFQLRYGIKRRGLAMQALHPMSLLAQSTEAACKGLQAYAKMTYRVIRHP